MTRIEREKKVVSIMIDLYARAHKGREAECAALKAYALTRLERCPFGEEKTMCQFCKVHCYRPKMQARIKEVMRYSGPRMLFHAPITAVQHLWATLLYKLKVRS